MTTCFAEQKFSCHDFCFVEIEDTNTLMRTAEQRPLKMLDKKKLLPGLSNYKQPTITIYYVVVYKTTIICHCSVL